MIHSPNWILLALYFSYTPQKTQFDRYFLLLFESVSGPPLMRPAAFLSNPHLMRGAPPASLLVAICIFCVLLLSSVKLNYLGLLLFLVSRCNSVWRINHTSVKLNYFTDFMVVLPDAAAGILNNAPSHTGHSTLDRSYCTFLSCTTPDSILSSICAV